MACNDDRAQQVIEATKIAGLNVPEQVAVVGVDNADWFMMMAIASQTEDWVSDSFGYYVVWRTSTRNSQISPSRKTMADKFTDYTDLVFSREKAQKI